MKRKIRFGIVGAGRISQAYAQAFRTTDLAEVVGVADVRREAAEALAEELNCRDYASHQDMTEDRTLDAVVVCTPPVSHPGISLFFLKRKVSVLCEKPLCIDLPSATEMLDEARNAGALLTMASKFRYVRDVVRAKSIVASGVLGEIVQFENGFSAPVNMSERWNSNPAISGGGVLIDNGTHSVDILRYFLGPIAEINVVEGLRKQNLPVEETVSVLTRNVNGVIGTIDLSWSVNKAQDSYLRIYGTNGSLSVGWQESKYRYNSSPEWHAFGKGYNKVEAFRSQIENFSKAILGDEGLLLTTEDALASVEVIAAAYTSLRQKRWVPVSVPGHSKTEQDLPARLEMASKP